MHYIMMIIFGFVVGVLARFVMPGKDSMGWIMTTILGIVGSMVGGYISQLLGFTARTETASWLMSVGGALLVLFVFNRANIGKKR